VNEIELIDLTNKNVFPNTEYRFSRVIKTSENIILERDFIGENPLHYYVNSKSQKIVVANSIREIKRYVEACGSKFLWEYVRAVSNNKKVVITSKTFYDSRPTTTELQPTLQAMVKPMIDFSNMNEIGKSLRVLLIKSTRARIASIRENTSGLLLSGGLDSITTGYFLKNNSNGKNIRAFTLKVHENDPDIVKARVIAKRLYIPLTEVKISRNVDEISIHVEVYDDNQFLEKEYHLVTLKISQVVKKTLEIAENPKRDNLFCSLAMYLIGMVIKNEGIKTVFCGEGPNEMINDYGFLPIEEGYSSMGISDTYFRQALTFGLKEADMQLGRGGLAKHALSRMGKIFLYYGIRLESTFFNSYIANIITRIPYADEEYSVIKPIIDAAILGEEGKSVLGSLENISKEKFQDGSGISRLFKEYDQYQLTKLFKEIYGVNKDSYI